MLGLSRVRRHGRKGIEAAALLLFCAFHARAEPYVAGLPNANSNTEVASDTTVQLYEIRSPSGQTVLTRRRFLTTFGVSSYDLTNASENPRPRSGAEFNFRSRLRYDADYGAAAAEANPADLARYVPGFERGPVDLMYAYLEGRRLLGGFLGFRLGRLIQTDVMGFYALDGAEVRLHSPYYVGAQVSAGLEVRGGFPLSTPRYERDGIWRGTRENLDPNYWGSFVEPSVAPTAGVALETEGLSKIHARVSYRTAYSTGNIATNPYKNVDLSKQDFGARLSEERLGASLNYTPIEALGLKAGTVVDVFLRRASLMYLSADVYASEKVSLSADYDYTRPSFSADSIWNFFAINPQHHLGVRSHLQLSRKWSFGVGSFVRAFENSQPEAKASVRTTPDFYPKTGATFLGGGDLSVRHTFGRGRLGARADASSGESGSRYGSDVFADISLEKRFLLSGRVSLWRWFDSAKPERSADGLGYVAGLGYLMGARQRTQLEFEHNANRLVGTRYRIMLTFALAVSP
jgi:hypothetical protein